eukprot:gene20869-1280_t
MSSQPTKKRRTASGSKATATPEAGPATEGGGSAKVPQEEMDAKVIECCSTARTNTYIQDTLGIDKAGLMSALNRLLAQGKMEIVQASDGKKLKYIRKDEARTQLEAKMDSYEERLVYQQIEDSKSRGIWVKNLREQTGLEQNVIKRLLRKMETKQLIKKVSSVAAPKKPMYMLFEMVPDVSLTGGPWYSGSDFDREFIYQLSEFVVRLSEAKVKKAAAAFSEQPLKRLEASCFTAESILADINGSGAFTVELQEKDIVQIISSLVWESKLTVIVTGRQKVSDDGSADEPKKYKAHSSRIEIVGACEEGPDVTPAETCNCSGCVQRFVLAHLLDDGI